MGISLIKGHPETPRKSRQCGTEVLNRGPQWGPHSVISPSLGSRAYILDRSYNIFLWRTGIVYRRISVTYTYIVHIYKYILITMLQLYK